jgi:hypothetical protein
MFFQVIKFHISKSSCSTRKYSHYWGCSSMGECFPAIHTGSWVQSRAPRKGEEKEKEKEKKFYKLLARL